MKSMYIAFGEGGIDIEIYLYDQPYSIEKLMQSLLYNNYTQT